MEQRRRNDGRTRSHPSPRDLATPPGAVAAYLLVAVACAVLPALTPAAGPLAVVGRAVLAVLVLHAIHEGGHVLAGLGVGLPLQAVSLGPVTLRRERRAGRRAGHLVWDANHSWRRFAGCVEREVEPAPGMRVALTVTALAGPVASIVGGALLAAVGGWREVGYTSILIGVVNALPVHVLGQTSDGLIVRRLWSPRAEDVAWRAQFCGPDAMPAAPAGAVGG